MHRNLLKIIHSTILTRSIKYNYGKIPHNLPSLDDTKTDDIQIKKDYRTLTKHFGHPLFVNFVPSYNQLIDNEYTPWLNLYIKNNN